MDMSRTGLLMALEESLQDAATRMDGPGDLERALDLAALDLGRVRPRTREGAIDLEAGKRDYAAPEDLLQITVCLWGLTRKRALRPWEPGWPGLLPRLSVIEMDTGRLLLFDTAPTAAHIHNAGSRCRFYYRAGHLIGDMPEDTTVMPGDAHLLILRAQAETMKELAMRGSTKPVRLRDGQTQGARNGTPAGLYEHLMRQFDAQGAP